MRVPQVLRNKHLGIVVVGLAVLAVYFLISRLIPHENLQGLLEDVSNALGAWTYLLVGLLAFLLVDTMMEALEFADEAAAIFQGSVMVILIAMASFLTLVGIGRRHGSPTGLALATYIATGIGLHNLGEGLAIGAAFAAGSAGLGTFLVLGFTLHNITEGIGIAAPLVKEPPPLSAFVWLALLAGAPAILGMWFGSLAYSPQWAALALAIGAGAILQVIVEVGVYLWRLDDRWKTGAVPVSVFGGLGPPRRDLL